MKTHSVQKVEANQRIDKFLKKQYPNLPHTLLFKYFRIKRIKVNGGKIPPNYLIQEGDVLSLYINDEFLVPPEHSMDFLEAKGTLSIHYEDENILLLEKPEKVSIHDGKNSLLHQVHKYLNKKDEYLNISGSSFKPTFPHRLDTNTRGLIIACKNSLSLREMNHIIQNKGLKKEYYSIVYGKTNFHHTRQIAYHTCLNQNQVLVKKHPFPEAKQIETIFHTIKVIGDFSLLKILLITGKKHQIRAHLALLNHPILGDQKYSSPQYPPSKNYPHQLLIANSLTFHLEGISCSLLTYLNGAHFSLKKEKILEDCLKELAESS